MLGSSLYVCELKSNTIARSHSKIISSANWCGARTMLQDIFGHSHKYDRHGAGAYTIKDIFYCQRHKSYFHLWHKTAQTKYNFWAKN